MAEIFTKLQKISTGQNKQISEVEELKKRLLKTDKTLSDLGKRMSEQEGHYQDVLSLRTEIAAIQAESTATIHLVSELENRLDNAENRCRSNNLIFYILQILTQKKQTM